MFEFSLCLRLLWLMYIYCSKCNSAEICKVHTDSCCWVYVWLSFEFFYAFIDKDKCFKIKLHLQMHIYAISGVTVSLKNCNVIFCWDFTVIFLCKIKWMKNLTKNNNYFVFSINKCLVSSVWVKEESSRRRGYDAAARGRPYRTKEKDASRISSRSQCRKRWRRFRK